MRECLGSGFDLESFIFIFSNKSNKTSCHEHKKKHFNLSSKQINSSILVTCALYFSDHCFQQYIFVSTDTHRQGLHQNIHLPDKYFKYTYEQKHKGIFIPACEIHTILSISHTHTLKYTFISAVASTDTSCCDQMRGGRETLTAQQEPFKAHSRTFTHLVYPSPEVWKVWDGACQPRETLTLHWVTYNVCVRPEFSFYNTIMFFSDLSFSIMLWLVDPLHVTISQISMSQPYCENLDTGLI